MGPATEQKNDFKKLLHDENDDMSIDIVKSQTCQYFEPEEVHNLFTPNCFSIFSHNIRSLSGNFKDLRDLLYNMLPGNFSVIALQEIWSINKMYDLTGYKQLLYKTRDMNTDPNPNCGGGVGFFVQNDLQYEVLEDESVFISGVYESLWIKVKIGETYKIIGNVYRPNSAPKANLKKAISIHEAILTKITTNKKHSKCSIEIVSDFNVDLLKFQEHELTNSYLELLLSFSLLPAVTKPTRITHNTASLIDHICVLNKSNQHNSGIILSYISDHFPTFYIDQTRSPKPKKKPFKIRKINDETQNDLNNLLKASSFQNITSQDDPALAFSNFFTLWNSAAELSFPEITVNPKTKSKFVHSPWMTPGLLVSCKTKQKLFSKKLQKPTVANISTFKTFNIIYNNCRKKAKKNHYNEMFDACKRDLKLTWKLVREVSCTRKGQARQLPEYFRYQGNTIRSPQEIANNFNQFFTEIGPQLADKIPKSKKHLKDFLSTPSPLDFQFTELSEQRILNFVKKIKPKASYGEDFISNKVLKFIAPTIIQPLKHIINISLQTGFFPDQFKIAKVIPIYKDSDCHEFSNYRPISLINSLSRLIESTVCFQVTGFADACDLFDPHQYGFRAKHNVNHPLLQFSEKIFEALNEGKISLAVFIDLKKAFDTVDYKILLEKLKHYGIRNTELLWFENYLQNRQQYVHLSSIAGESNINSCKLPCKCGIPQGSCLGPLLFLFFINDLTKATDFFTLLFADDCTFQITATNSSSLFKRANEELNKAEQWFSANKLTINAKKTKYILYKDPNSHIHVEDLYISQSIISRVGQFCEEKSVRFLGVWVDDQMSFTDHMSKLKSKLISGIYALSTSCKLVSLSVRKLIYRSLVESHIRFAAILYGASNPTMLNPLRVLQRKAVRIVAGANFNAHTGNLFKVHNFLKLDDIVQLSQTLFVRQFKNKQLPISFSSFFQNLSDQVLRDHDYNLKPKIVKRNFLTYYPSVQLIRAWNCNNLLLKSEAELVNLKSDFTSHKLNNYETECAVVNCYVCIP